MPTDTNLPTMVHLYLEMVTVLMMIPNEYESTAPVSQTIRGEIEFYFGKCREELEKVKSEI